MQGAKTLTNINTKLWINLSLLITVLMLFSSASFAIKIVQLNIKGAIGPATADYIERGISEAQDADLILVIMDTPGGLDYSTRLIIKQFLNSKVPIVTYVSPNGARAASAGVYLLYASTLAAMAPGTHLGAATPVNISEGFAGDAKEDKAESSMQKKIINDALATLRSLAQLRGRNLAFAENAVLNAATMTANEALNNGVINYIAKDTNDLLAQLNSVVVMQNNQKITLNTSDAEIKVTEPDWRTELLSVITNPTVAYLILLLGIYGIFFELVNPGYVLPGVIGAVSMLIALYALQLMPINYAGLGLIILGILFVVAEAFTPSFGALGLGGTIAFILGSIMLMDTHHSGYQIAWAAIGAMALVNILIFIVIVGMAVKARRQAVKNGLVMLLGSKGRTIGIVNLQGQAVIRGEIWSVHAKNPISADTPIRVIAASGLLLEVEEEQAGNITEK